jgi:hypothetical protein
MKQKLIAIASGLAAIGFLGRNQISSLTSKYITHSDTTTVLEAAAPESVSPELVDVDTLLERSKNSISSAGTTTLKSDSVLVKRVEKTVTKIENLNHEVKVLKKENRELRARLNDTDNVDGHFGLLPISAEAIPVE